MLARPWQKFSKVSALVHLRYKATIKTTFENVHTVTSVEHRDRSRQRCLVCRALYGMAQDKHVAVARHAPVPSTHIYVMYI